MTLDSLIERAKQLGNEARYIAYVKRWPSWLTGIHAEYIEGDGVCEPAHVRKVEAGSGMALKPEFCMVPLTHAEHAMQHQKGASYFASDDEWLEGAAFYLNNYIYGRPVPVLDLDPNKHTFTVSGVGRLRAVFLYVSDLVQQQPLEITVKKHKPTRSSRQNRYYWGVVVASIRAYFKEQGYVVSQEFVHNFLKIDIGGFYYEVQMPNGEIRKCADSSAKLSKAEWEDWMTKIRVYFAELGLTIPEPNEGERYDF